MRSARLVFTSMTRLLLEDMNFVDFLDRYIHNARVYRGVQGGRQGSVARISRVSIPPAHGTEPKLHIESSRHIGPRNREAYAIGVVLLAQCHFGGHI